MTMKKTGKSRVRASTVSDLRPEYRFEYRKAKPNRFAGQAAEDRVVVVLERDVARVFPDSRSVNNALRALAEIANRKARRAAK
jgi:hypothetical protein